MGDPFVTFCFTQWQHENSQVHDVATFKILREAGLIRSERKGVELNNSTRCHELKKKYGPMITGILQAYANEGKKSAR